MNSEKIIELYQRNYSQREVAEELDITRYKVRKTLSKEEAMRSKEEAAKYRKIREPVPFRTGTEGYESWWDQTGQQRDRKTDVLRHHRLLAVAEYGIEQVKDNVVHHKNAIPWDNRPENIELMSRERHGKIHGIEAHE